VCTRARRAECQISHGPDTPIAAELTNSRGIAAGIALLNAGVGVLFGMSVSMNAV
jgi:hypothetical protein